MDQQKAAATKPVTPASPLVVDAGGDIKMGTCDEPAASPLPFPPHDPGQQAAHQSAPDHGLDLDDAELEQ
eukprot:2864149-Pyramimonas_sp.AAC.1